MRGALLGAGLGLLAWAALLLLALGVLQRVRG